MWIGPVHGYQELVDMFWERTLKGVRNGVERLPVATSLGRTATGAAEAATTSGSWPPARTAPLTLHLGRSFDTVPGAPDGLVGSEDQLYTCGARIATSRRLRYRSA